MGDPKKIRKKYTTPNHPWNKDRIELEKSLSREYGFTNKKEIWKMESKLTKFKDQVKALAMRTGEQGQKEKMQLMNKLTKYGLLKQGETIDKVLGLDVKDILNRRLQTIMFKKGLARTVKQARQFIVHGHVTISDKKITAPSYMVSLAEEQNIGFIATSTLHDTGHPERATPEKMPKQEKAKEKKEAAKSKIMTDEEKEAAEITEELGEEEQKVIEDVEKETPAEEVKEIIEKNEETTNG